MRYFSELWIFVLKKLRGILPWFLKVPICEWSLLTGDSFFFCRDCLDNLQRLHNSKQGVINDSLVYYFKCNCCDWSERSHDTRTAHSGPVQGSVIFFVQWTQQSHVTLVHMLESFQEWLMWNDDPPTLALLLSTSICTVARWEAVR